MMKKRGTCSTIATLLAAAALGGMVLLTPVGASTESRMAEERLPVVADPAMLDLGNTDAGAMMAMISSAVSLHD